MEALTGVTSPKRILVTGGAGFIGSALVRELIGRTQHHVLNVDALTYAGNLENLRGVAGSPRYRFERSDICDQDEMLRLMDDFRPTVIVHLAAESHVDRSIDGPADFLRTNVFGTVSLLEAARAHFSKLGGDSMAADFRFHHVSTDEVYGDLGGGHGRFREDDPYRPSSPYSASKASSDHFVRAWGRTYGLPVVVSNCSNNYGPYQFPEKLIPHMVLCALREQPLPVYGRGEQVRDWIHVEDHARALIHVALEGRLGETYNIGGDAPMRNIDVVEAICALMDELLPSRRPTGGFRSLIRYVSDRPGHDVRYAVDSARIREDLGWSPEVAFPAGLRSTVAWYLENADWWERVLDGSYRLERIGG